MRRKNNILFKITYYLNKETINTIHTIQHTNHNKTLNNKL
jgi:hypothetical protein